MGAETNRESRASVSGSGLSRNRTDRVGRCRHEEQCRRLPCGLMQCSALHFVPTRPRACCERLRAALYSQRSLRRPLRFLPRAACAPRRTTRARRFERRVRASAVAAFLRSIGLAEAAAHAEDAALDGETLVHTLAKPDAAVIVRPPHKRVAPALPPRCRRVASIPPLRSAAARRARVGTLCCRCSAAVRSDRAAHGAGRQRRVAGAARQEAFATATGRQSLNHLRLEKLRVKIAKPAAALAVKARPPADGIPRDTAVPPGAAPGRTAEGRVTRGRRAPRRARHVAQLRGAAPRVATRGSVAALQPSRPKRSSCRSHAAAARP